MIKKKKLWSIHLHIYDKYCIYVVVVVVYMLCGIQEFFSVIIKTFRAEYCFDNISHRLQAFKDPPQSRLP